MTVAEHTLVLEQIYTALHSLQPFTLVGQSHDITGALHTHTHIHTQSTKMLKAHIGGSYLCIMTTDSTNALCMNALDSVL